MSVCQISTKPKFEVLNRFLLDEYILIHIDPTRPGVVVPAHLMQGQVLTLKLSKLFRGAMDLSQDKVTADLLFEQDYFSCTVPLNAVWGATNDKGETVVWPDSAPPNVLKGIPQPQTAAAPAPTPTAAVSTTSESPAAEPVLKKKGHLTRVK